MPEMLSYRRSVGPADCDQLGHMNVGRFLEICGEGGFAIQAAVGLTRQDMATGRRLSFVVVRAEAEFLREAQAGDVLTARSSVLETGGKSVTFRHRILREDGEEIFRATFRCALMDLSARRAVPLDNQLRGALEAFRAE